MTNDSHDESTSAIWEPDDSTLRIRRFLGVADGEFIELTALCYNRPWIAQCSTIKGHISLLADAHELRGFNGAYMLVNGPVNPILSARYEQDRWESAWNGRASDNDIGTRRAVFIDIDPIRPPGISATEEEQNAAWEVACGVHDFIIERIGEMPVGHGCSGNGYYLLVAIEPVPNPGEQTERINRLLKLLHRKFGTAQVKIDTAVSNPARLMCAPGTCKRKGQDTDANAFSQLSNRLGAPVEFVRDRLPAPLQLATMNYLLASAPQAMSAQLRLRGDEVSAVVSDRYAPLDAVEFVETLRQALSQQGLLSSVRARAVATGTTDLMRLVVPSESQAIKVGDVTAVGLDLSTSSFGRSALHVRGLLWRLKCTNGLRTAEGMGQFSYRHVGETQRLRDGLRDAIPTALVHARGVMDLWKKAVGVFVTNVAAEIDALRLLNLSERERVEDEVKKEAHVLELPERVSAYDFVNAITSTAHDAEPARRLEIEELAGGLLRRHVGQA